MVAGSAARITRQIIHSTVGQGRWWGRGREKRKGGRRRKNRFIQILALYICTYYTPQASLHLEYYL